jgi:alpha/beta superfamily hydrolase
MELPKIPEGTTPFFQGAAAGAVALAIVGFNWGGWVTGGTAQKMADGRADKAVAAALTPVCVFQFSKGADAPATLKAFKGLNSWEQDEYVGKGGWAKMPGSGAAEPTSQTVSSCVEALNKLVL